MNVYYSIALSAIIGVVDAAIKNPNSDRALALRDKLEQLHASLGILLQKWGAR